MARIVEHIDFLKNLVFGFFGQLDRLTEMRLPVAGGLPQQIRFRQMALGNVTPVQLSARHSGITLAPIPVFTIVMFNIHLALLKLDGGIQSSLKAFPLNGAKTLGQRGIG